MMYYFKADCPFQSCWQCLTAPSIKLLVWFFSSQVFYSAEFSVWNSFETPEQLRESGHTLVSIQGSSLLRDPNAAEIVKVKQHLYEWQL